MNDPARRRALDAQLEHDNMEIDRQQTLQRMQRAGELLEALTFWPSPHADQNAARDIGRLLQGKPAERSQGYDAELDKAGPFALSWKQRAEKAEAEIANRGRALDAREEEMITRVVRRVAELPDRTSPDEWPEAMLVTADELQQIVSEEAADLLVRLIAQTEETEKWKARVESLAHMVRLRDQQAENTATVERVVDAIIQLPEFKEMRPELERYYLVNRVLDALVNRKP